MGFTHHLYLVEKMDWKEISIILSKLTKEILITEFKSNTAAIGSEKNITQSWKNEYNL